MSGNVFDLASIQAAAMAKAAAAQPKIAAVADAGKPLLVEGTEFLDAANPPKWLVRGVIQQGHVVSLTAPTNSGKTAVLLTLIMSVLSGKNFGLHEVAQPGRVLVLCGEDPDGFRLRMLGTMGYAGVTRADIAGRLRVLPQAMPLHEALPQIEREAAEWGDIALVIVDTSVAFFSGLDENNNLESLAHAHDLRAMKALPGSPAVIAACHPRDGAERDSCKPRGGSAFLNEIDCNLILWSERDGVTELHWSVKKRGPDFEPLWFEFAPQEVYCQGEKSLQVVAKYIDDTRAHERKKQHYHDDNRLLAAMNIAPTESMRDWARASGFMCGPDMATAQISKVQRCLVRLMRLQLVVKGFSPSGYVLTSKGKSAAEVAAYN